MKIFELIHAALKSKNPNIFLHPGTGIKLYSFPMLTLLGLTGPQMLTWSENFENPKFLHPGNGGSCTKTRPRFEFVICVKWKNFNCYENGMGFYQKWTTARSFNFRKEVNIVICSSMLKVVSFIDIFTRHRKSY